MDCERYQAWLADKALGALDAGRDAELAAHLALCPGCRAALEREQLLFAAIHRGVAKSVSASPSPEMAVRIRRRVAAEAVEAEHGWRFGSRLWISVAIAAALLLSFGSVWLIHRRSVERLERTKSVAGEAAPPLRSLGSSLPAVATAGNEGVEEPKPGASPAHRAATPRVVTRPPTRVSRTSSAEPEVLVDKEEAALVLQLYYSANHLPAGDGASAHLSAEPERDADGNLAALQIPPLQITALEPTPDSEETEGKNPADDRPGDIQR